MTKRIIDAHSHIGKDSFFPFEGNIQEYVEKAMKIGITDSMLMPVTSPMLTVNGRKTSQLLWKYNTISKKFDFDSMGVHDSIDTDSIKLNPYALANYITMLNLKENNAPIKLHFIPLIHPLLDSLQYIEYITTQNIKAIKIHGIAGGIGPNQISNDFWQIIKRSNLPIIVHTDFDGSGRITPITTLRNYNRAFAWIKAFEKNGIRGYITHGARLCSKSIEIINKSNLFVVGIGPDSLISLEPERLESGGNYLQTLFDNVSIDKLCFDLDYPWNVNKPIHKLTTRSINLDFGGITRIKTLGLSTVELDKVLFYNAEKFYRI